MSSKKVEGIKIAVADPETEAEDHVAYFNKVAGETRYCSFDGGCYFR